MPSAIAPASVTTITGNQGIDISYPYDNLMEYNHTLYVRFWVYNTSSGSLFTNATGQVTCIYNIMNNFGRSILRANDTSNPYIGFGIPEKTSTYGYDTCAYCFYLNVPNTLFNQTGLYSFQIRCQGRTASIGGYLNGNILVTNSGNETPTEWIIIIFMLLLIALSATYLITLMNIVEDFGNHNIDAVDVAKYLSLFIALITFKYFATMWLQMSMVDYVLEFWLKGTVISHVFIPCIGLFYSMFIKYILEMQKVRMNG